MGAEWLWNISSSTIGWCLSPCRKLGQFPAPHTYVWLSPLSPQHLPSRWEQPGCLVPGVRRGRVVAVPSPELSLVMASTP